MEQSKRLVWEGGKRGKADISSKTPIERRGDPIRTLGNTPTKINGRTYSGHALDLMQRDGVMPSVVENAIRNGQKHHETRLELSLILMMM